MAEPRPLSSQPIETSKAASVLDAEHDLTPTPVDPAWLRQWAAVLDPRRHPSVSGAAEVAALLRIQGSEPPPHDLARFVSLRLGQVGASPTPRNGHDGAHRLAAAPVVGTAPGVEPRSMAAGRVATRVRQIRVAEVLAGLSSALEMGEGHGVDHAIATCYAAVRIASALHVPDDELADLFYAALLKESGSAGRIAPGDAGLPGQGRDEVHERDAGAARPHLSRTERARGVIRSLGLPERVVQTVELYRTPWNLQPASGPLAMFRGQPERRSDVPLLARILAVADALARAVDEGPGNAERLLKTGRGTAYDPEIVELALRMGTLGLWREMAAPDLHARTVALEPAHRIRLADERSIDLIAATFADVVDTRTPRMGRHGRRVAALCERVGDALGLEEAVVRELRRAALLHDIGRLIVPIATLERPSGLSAEERAVVAEHARASATVLARTRGLARAADLASGHHEPLDGRGRFPEFQNDDYALAARVLAVVDRFEALTAPRPFRPPLSERQAFDVLHDAVSEPLAVAALRALDRSLEAENAAAG